LSHYALVSLLSGLGAGALGLVTVAGVGSQIVWILPLIGVALRWYSYRKGAPHLSPEGCEIRLKAWKGGRMHHMNTIKKGFTTAALRALAVIVGLALLGMVVTACGTVTGAAVGAGSGAAIGAAAGDAKKGALIGTGVGAAGGAIYDATR
jgi:hypothetical protein